MKERKDTWAGVLRPSGRECPIGLLQSFERDLGTSFPDDYRDFLITHNGGRVIVDHRIPLPEAGFDIQLCHLSPICVPSPGSGIIESRAHQVTDRSGVSRAIEIGDDGGTGFFMLSFRGIDRGSVYFAWKEDYWASASFGLGDDIPLPEEFVLVSPSFAALAQLILRHRERA